MTLSIESTATVPHQRIVFLDVEASGLGQDSFPIEVGWAFLEGGSGSLLIRPAVDWTLDAWEPFAEDIHGISWETLWREGRAARDVADHLNRLLGGQRFVLSDASDQDSLWLARLFEETPDAQAFTLTEERLARRLCLGEFVAGAGAELDFASREHRAEADALQLAAAWRDRMGPAGALLIAL